MPNGICDLHRFELITEWSNNRRKAALAVCHLPALLGLHSEERIAEPAIA